MRGHEAKGRILVAERSTALRADIKEALVRTGFDVVARGSVDASELNDARGAFDLLVWGIDAPGVEAALRDENFDYPVILLGGGETPPAGLGSQLGKAQADWLAKPFTLEALESRVLMHLREANGGSRPALDPLLSTQNPQFRESLARVETWARRAVPMTLVGEIGTGRLALARQIHAWSAQAHGPCLLLDSAVLESEGLSGAVQRIAMIRERALGGTIIWLDPADASSSVQSTILQSLRQSVNEDARWISIAAQSLESSAALGRLDRELQYRLEVAQVNLPALRDRPEDQLQICRAIARRIARELGFVTPSLTDEWVARLADLGFRGNRLGIESRFRAALIRSEGRSDEFQHWAEQEFGVASELPVNDAKRDAILASLNLKTLERETIVRALMHWEGNRTRASESLGISVRTLRNKIREYALH